MSTTPATGNLVKWYPPISDNPTPQELALNSRLLFNSSNDHDQAITLIHSRVETLEAAASSTTKSTTTTITNTVLSTEFPGLGTVNDQTGNAAYTTQTQDNGALLLLNDASAVAITLNIVATPFLLFASNAGAGLATFTPATGDINGNLTFTLAQNYFTLIIFDGTNWTATTLMVVPQNASAISSKFLTAYNAITGAFTAAQAAFTDISGIVSPSQLPPASVPLSGTSASIGGAPLTVGQTVSMTVTITGAAVGMVAMTSPQTYPGDGFVWDAYISAANTVTVRLTAALAATPAASLYSVRILQ